MSSTCQWLGRTVLALLVVVGLPQFAHADFIDLVSQTYLIHASGFGSFPGGTNVVVDYTETSNTPISRIDSVPVYMPTGNQVALFVLSTATDSGITPLSAFVRARSNQFDLGGFANAETAEAIAAITFRPLVNNVGVQAGSGLGRAGLYDLSAGAAVLALDPVLAVAFNVTLDVDHLYTMYASVSGPSRDVRLSIAPGPAYVPESGSTLTFFVVGLGALLVSALSQKFRPRAG